MLRQAIYGRLAGYEDVNDAERLAHDPAMRAVVGREGLNQPAASSSEMGRFATEWLTTEANLAALTDLSGRWIDGDKLKATLAELEAWRETGLATDFPKE